MTSYVRMSGVKSLMRWWIPGLISLMLVLPFVGTSTSSVSAQGVDEDRLEIALLQAYFLSVDNFAGPVMMGGMGLPLVPTMFTPEEFAPMMAMMAQMADFDLSMMPANPGLLSAIYTSADPKLPDGTTVDPMDFGTMRWDPAGFDTTITTRDQAMVILKFAEWAKFFYKGFGGESILFPSPQMEAFLSLAFTAEAMMVSNFTGQNLMTENGFITSINMDGDSRQVVDDTVRPFDQAAMLWALSDMMLTMKDPKFPNLGAIAQKLATPEMMASLTGMMNTSFDLVQANPSTDSIDKALSIVALVWYAAVTADDARRADVLAEIEQIAGSLGSVETTAFEKAASIRGLLEASRVTGNQGYMDTAMSLWNDLDGMWDDQAKTYAPTSGATTYTYTPWNAGLVIGALAEIVASGGVGISQDVQDLATNRFMDFLQTSIMASGFTHLPVPTPGSTGLFVSEISYDTSNDTWTVSDSRYTTAGSQYAANELIWLEGTLKGRQTGYPQVAPIVTEEPEPPSVGDATAPMWALAGIGALGALLLVSGGLFVVRRRRA